MQKAPSQATLSLTLIFAGLAILVQSVLIPHVFPRYGLAHTPRCFSGSV